MKKKMTSWGRVAKWYDALLTKSDDTYQARVILPNLLRILDPKPGETVVDVGCGQGYFTRAVAASKARVVGFDIAPELIALAKKRGPATIDYRVAPADDLRPLPEASVDAALLILALQNIEDISGALREAARILKRNGRLVLVLNHPAFRIPGRTSWEWDEKKKVQYRRVDGYLSDSHTKIQMHPGDAPEEVTISFHRPLQVYFKALGKNGFAVTRLEEWISHRKSSPGPRAKEEDRTRKEIPLFLCLEAVRV